MSSKQKIEAELRRITGENERLRKENASLRRQIGSQDPPKTEWSTDKEQHPPLTRASTVEEKIRYFHDLFRGRDDVYPIRWDNQKGKSGYSPACGNEWHKILCRKPKVKCGQCKNSQLLPVTDQVIHDHLIGRHTIGVYPILADGSCWFLAVDFDKSAWQSDISTFLDSCRQFDIPAYIERSRSGEGGHVWMFFDHAIPASTARKLGTLILTHAMDQRPEVGLDSYDRLFPSQDTVPKGGFGNLIALPLQKLPRQHGNSVFIDEEFNSIDDQWAHLRSIKRVTRERVHNFLEVSAANDNLLGVQRVSTLDEASEDLWTESASDKPEEELIDGEMPERITVVLSNQLYIEKQALPPALQNRLIRLAAFQNPEFYRAQAMRMSTYGKPRLIACAEDHPRHIALPRGCGSSAISLLQAQNISVSLKDERFGGTTVDVEFQGELRLAQQKAVEALLEHDTGLFCAPTAFGKTVVAAAIIAHRKVNTLVLVHRRQLMEQWRERLAVFLEVPVAYIGQIGGGRRQQTGDIDVAVIQSLNRKGQVNDLVRDYGQVIVDEAHHLSAFSFEAVLKQAKARYVLGLTATPVRKDGHHPIILMQCGSIRHRVTMREERDRTNVVHRLVPRVTNFRDPAEESETGIQALYGALAISEERNEQIFNDILQALEAGRSPLVLTERVGHLELLAERLGPFARNVIVLRGGRGQKKSSEALEKLATIPNDEERLLLATGRYIGEGFDDARLDTLFLTMPISWKGTLRQYVGRLHRQHSGKNEVRVYDYVDQEVPVLRRMYARRLKGYKAMGYEISTIDDSI